MMRKERKQNYQTWRLAADFLCLHGSVPTGLLAQWQHTANQKQCALPLS